MHRLKHLTLPLLIFYAAAASAGEPRFSGSSGLAKPQPASASTDGRFSVSADLRPAAAAPQVSGRFALIAKLQPDAKSITSACDSAVGNIFRNGFE